ncbi:hypothetical protein L2U69_11875 [Zavarzinia compransoris]|uniref:hypothetical protein n=1 Tax=Zavarzinia marina TaxID=2911065 RepID=UPI001F3A3A30|nr:hypothetical protein [Zavarzinia marina]MCF4166345.1 hypothetical protein [Zavarzinia marina]
MTTVAYKDGIIAADTALGTGKGGCIATVHVRKIGRAPCGGLVGCSGQADSVAAVVRRVEEGGFGAAGLAEVPPAADGFFVSRGGAITIIGEQGCYPVRGAVYACGSGEIAALAAMMAGASAEEAVRIAIQLDHATGGEVETLEIR